MIVKLILWKELPNKSEIVFASDTLLARVWFVSLEPLKIKKAF